MKLAELAHDLHLSTDSLIKFIQDFDLELSECIATNFEVRSDFEKFIRENIEFLRNYEKDLESSKTIDGIATQTGQPAEKVAEILQKEQPLIYDNGIFKSSVSTFGIDRKLGGNYEFVYNYFGKQTKLQQRDFIGYRDLFFNLSKALDPFLNWSPIADWGIHKPSGILLYGPPGSGKIFWANKIAEIIGYRFREVKRYHLSTSYINGTKTNFKDYLTEILREEKTLLFLSDFGDIVQERAENKSVNSCDEEVKETILHHISFFNKENILMVGAANTLEGIDRELLAPGRFDVLIPIFPPNAQERSEMILHHMTEGLCEDALLMKILTKQQAHRLPFWQEIASRMKAFSNTMMVDFTQSLKKRIRDKYLKTERFEIDLKPLMLSAYKDAAAKLTDEYLNLVSHFLTDASRLSGDDYISRIGNLKEELLHYRVVEKPRRKIGFSTEE